MSADKIQARHRTKSGSRKSIRTQRTDVVIPIVFPDYKIATPVGRLSSLGHAGVLIINGYTGTTKYYEYGRYDRANLGLVRRIRIPNVQIGKDGKPTSRSLRKTLRAISKKAGHKGRISAVYIEVSDKYKEMYKFAEGRKKQNSNPKRKPYSIVSNNCMTFAKETIEATGINTPLMIDPRPNSYADELSGEFRKLDYNPKKNTLYIEAAKNISD